MSLETVISSFSTDDYSRFLTFLNKKNKRTDVKNIELFRLVYTGELSSQEMCEQLYPNQKKDAYHALRKRLYESLIDFLASINLEEENSEKVEVIKYILVARSFLEQGQLVLGFKLLDKAKIIAQDYQLYPYLNEIYHLKIQYAHSNEKESLNDLILEFNKNRELARLEEELNIVYAKVRAILNKITTKGEVVDFQKIVLKILHEQNIDIDETLSFKSLYQLLTIASISAFVSKDYLQVESFMLDMYALLKEHPNKERERFYHIHVLYMIANTLFRTKQFEKSLTFLELMNAEILKNKRKYERVFRLKHTLLYTLNLNYSNQQDKAILILEETLKKKHTDVIGVLDLHLSLVVFYSQKGEIKVSYRLVSKLYHTDKWYIEKVGKEWVIKKNLIEILLLVELDNFDVFENRLSNFKRQYGAYLKEIGQERVLTFLKYVALYYDNPKEITSETFFSTLENSFDWVGAKQEDIFVMSFYAWLKSKMINEPVYEVTLDLISQAQEL
ncbi:hypothetical protein [Tenacibaculum agarivorans]|uniref:hypothetical protein n=1 Tax=Tenacibaculum agarivorans TaxID=1908389 RepID=UPI00094B7F75|nr:hypothetical protein [Tenacibaculum agarivorans]